MKTIALFGGSFDPPHIGHKAIVKAALHFQDISKVVVMPTYLSPFKSTSHNTSEQRFTWLKEMFCEDEDVEISRYEIDQKKSVASIYSVKYLLKKYLKIYLIIGADNVATLKEWHKYEELKEHVTFLVATRDNILIPKSYLTLKIDENISSTQIRNNIAKQN